MKRIAAKYVYLLDGIEPIRNSFVEFSDDGTVIAVGEADSADNILDGALVPGFVNAHCHVELSYMKGLFRKGTGMAGFIDQINALRDTKSHEEKVRDLSEAMDLMWERGVSAMADISNCDDSFAVKAAHPMYTRTFLEVFGTEPEDCPSVMASVRELQEKAIAAGLDAAPTPHACYTMSPQLLTAASMAGLESGFLSYHSEESSEEEDMIRFGRGPMWDNRKNAGMSTPPVTGKSSLLYFIDRLKEGTSAPIDGHILLVHEVCLDQKGIDAVKSTMLHPFFALCPLSNIFIHNALPPIPLMRRNGLKLCIGTDSLSSNDDLDMLKEIFCLQENFPEVPLGELFTWASSNGADFLSRNELGSFSEGKNPGAVFVDHLDREGRLTSASRSRRMI